MKGGGYYTKHYMLKKIRKARMAVVCGKCELCGDKALHAHHINMDHNDHRVQNVIIVCPRCHTTLHRDPSSGRMLLQGNGDKIEETSARVKEVSVMVNTGKKGASGAPRKESLCGEYVAVLLTAQDRTWIDSVALRSGRSVSSVVRRIVERTRKAHTAEQEAAL